MDKESRFRSVIAADGDSSISDETWETVKEMIREKSLSMSSVFAVLYEMLRSKHVEDRRRSVLLMDRLFCRLKQFRAIVCEHLQEFSVYALGTDHKEPIPVQPPLTKALEAEALACLQRWSKKYGKTFTRLPMCLKFYQKMKGVLVEDLRSERSKRRAERKRAVRLLSAKYDRTIREMKEMYPELQSILVQVNEVFGILFAAPVSTLVPGIEWSDWDDNCEQEIEATGLEEFDEDPEASGLDSLSILGLNQDYSLTIAVPHSLREKQSPDNEVLFQVLKDHRLALQKKFRPVVKDWVNIVGQFRAPKQWTEHRKAFHETVKSRIVDLWTRLEEAETKMARLLDEVEAPDPAKERHEEPVVAVASSGGRRSRALDILGSLLDDADFPKDLMRSEQERRSLGMN